MTRTLENLYLDYCEAGDTDALREVVDRATPELLLAATRLTADPNTAEDLVQSTWLAALQRPEGFDRARPLLPWLIGILVNKARDGYRAPANSVAPAALDIAVEQSNHGGDVRDQVIAATLRLSAQQRLLVHLHLFHELSVKEIADALGREPPGIQKELRRGIDKLRALLPRGIAPAALATLLGTRGVAAMRARLLARTRRTATGTLTVWLATALLLATLALFADPADPSGPAPVAAPAAGASQPRRSTSAAPRQRAGRPVEPGGATVIRVVRQADGGPARDVGVRVAYHDGRPRAFSEYRATTDARGEVRLRGARTGPATIELDRRVNRAVRLGESAAIELVVPRGATVTGAVAAPDGTPFPNAEIWYAGDPREPDASQPVTRADAFGRFELLDVQSGAGVFARAPGHAPSAVWAMSPFTAHDAEITLMLRSGAVRVTGRVTDAAGRPIAGAVVRAGAAVAPARAYWGRTLTFSPAPRRTVTNADGRFEIAHLQPGRVETLVRASGYRAASAATVIHAGREAGIAVTLERGELIRGVVRAATGAPLAGARVTTSIAGDEILTDADGRFAISGEPELELVASRVGFEPATVAAADATEIVLSPLHSQTVSLRDARGLALPGCAIEAEYRRPGSASARYASATSDADGNAALELPLGHLAKLRVREPGSPIATTVPEVLRVEARPWHVTLGDDARPSCTLVGRLVDAIGRPRTGTLLLGSFRHVAEIPTDASGRFALTSIPAGSYPLRLKNDSGTVPKHFGTIDLPPGATTDLGHIGSCRTGTLRWVGEPSIETSCYIATRDEREIAVLIGSGGEQALPVGRYTLRARGHGMPERVHRFEIHAGAVTEIELSASGY